MRNARWTRGLGLAVAATIALVGCWEGGMNEGESTPGNKPGGQTLGEELALSDDGRYLVTKSAEEHGATVWAVDLEDLRAVRLPVGDGDGSATTKMVFGASERAYFLSHAWGDRDESDRLLSTVHEISLSTGRETRSWPLKGSATHLSIDEEHRRIAAWTRGPWKLDGEPDVHRIVVLDLDGGQPRSLDLPTRTEDVRWIPSTGDLAAVQPNENMQSTVTLFEGPGLEPHDIAVPNCASSLEVAPDGETAMLAPTHCSKDPVSVIDLEARTFVENLPGFGPVDFSPDGRWALAFGRRADLERVAGIETEAAYSLLFIDTETLDIEVLELGADLPIYSVTPDGQVVLIYSVLQSSAYDGIVMVDVETRTLRETSGPEVDLSEFVMTPDGRLVYLVDGGLFRLDVDTGMITYVSLPCGGPGEPTRCNPDLVNLLPGGETLVLGFRMDAEFSLYDIPSSLVTLTFMIEPDTGADPTPVTVK
ncbi:MAG: hypothetical protein ACQEXJ_01300 [Myxococcota bacterium]